MKEKEKGKEDEISMGKTFGLAAQPKVYVVPGNLVD